MLDLVGTLACVAALLPAGARWLRVAQREHYLPGSTTRFAWRWWALRLPSRALALVALAAAAVAFAYPVFSLATAAAVIVGPRFLGVRGRTSPLAFTRRLRLLAALWLVLQAVVIGVGILVHHAAPPFSAPSSAGWSRRTSPQRDPVSHKWHRRWWG
jgi:UDP-N-acetylmuramoyl-tripeptide--D-alanyl-D-alanine ligase